MLARNSDLTREAWSALSRASFNSRCALSMLEAIWLTPSASWTNSSLPSTVHRVERSPCAILPTALEISPISFTTDRPSMVEATNPITSSTRSASNRDLKTIPVIQRDPPLKVCEKSFSSTMRRSLRSSMRPMRSSRSRGEMRPLLIPSCALWPTSESCSVSPSASLQIRIAVPTKPKWRKRRNSLTIAGTSAGELWPARKERAASSRSGDERSKARRASPSPSGTRSASENLQ